jgi:integrase/recombinase XerD
MKPTDFAEQLSRFLSHHLTAQRNLSANTVKAYRDVYMLLLRYCRDERGIPVERLRLDHINVALVEDFLKHLESERGCSIRTLNHRLAAVHAFFRYIQAELPERLLQCQQIMAIPLRRHALPSMEYLSKSQLATVLAQPDLQSSRGRRDAVLLSVLYDTGARVQELIDLDVGDARLESPAQIRLTGKGRKVRAVPLMDATVQLITDYLCESELDTRQNGSCPLFRNRQGNRLTRGGVSYILRKYVTAARGQEPGLAKTISPHSLRHTKGMHLLQSGVPLEIIRDFLGHADARTTHIYAHANLEMKRRALESMNEDNSPVSRLPSWQENPTLMDWLHNL